MTTDMIMVGFTALIVMMVGYFFYKSVTTNYKPHKH